MDNYERTVDPYHRALAELLVEQARALSMCREALQKILRNEEFVGSPHSASAEIARNALGAVDRYIESKLD